MPCDDLLKGLLKIFFTGAEVDVKNVSSTSRYRATVHRFMIDSDVPDSTDKLSAKVVVSIFETSVLKLEELNLNFRRC